MPTHLGGCGPAEHSTRPSVQGKGGVDCRAVGGQGVRLAHGGRPPVPHTVVGARGHCRLLPAGRLGSGQGVEREQCAA